MRWSDIKRNEDTQTLVIVQKNTNIETTKNLLGHKSLKSTAVYADVLTDEKVKAIDNTKRAFRSRILPIENMKIAKTKRTAATNRHPRRLAATQDNK